MPTEATHYQVSVIRSANYTRPLGVSLDLVPSFAHGLILSDTKGVGARTKMYSTKEVAENRGQILASAGLLVTITPMALQPVGTPYQVVTG
jgi:hypothetical protein